MVDWPLNDYELVADWADLIRADLLNCSMPPADAAAGAAMTDADRVVLLNWILCGTPP